MTLLKLVRMLVEMSPSPLLLLMLVLVRLTVLAAASSAVLRGLLADPEVRIIIIGVRADVDDSIHVQIEIVKLRNLIFLHHFTQTWIPLTQPTIKLRNPHLDGL